MVNPREEEQDVNGHLLYKKKKKKDPVTTGGIPTMNSVLSAVIRNLVFDAQRSVYMGNVVHIRASLSKTRSHYRIDS